MSQVRQYGSPPTLAPLYGSPPATAAEKSVLIMDQAQDRDTDKDKDKDNSWFRKSSTVSFLEPAIDLARRLSVKIYGTRGNFVSTDNFVENFVYDFTAVQI